MGDDGQAAVAFDGGCHGLAFEQQAHVVFAHADQAEAGFGLLVVAEHDGFHADFPGLGDLQPARGAVGKLQRFGVVHISHSGFADLAKHAGQAVAQNGFADSRLVLERIANQIARLGAGAEQGGVGRAFFQHAFDGFSGGESPGASGQQKEGRGFFHEGSHR